MEQVNRNIFFKIGFHTGLFEMTVGVLTTYHTQYTWDRSICFFLFNRTTLQVFVTYLTGALYVHPLWFYKHQHNNRVRSKMFVACQRWWFQWLFWFVPSVPGFLRKEEEHKPDPWRNAIERNHMGLYLENEVARRVASDHHRSPRPIHRCGKCWFKNSLTCRWKWCSGPSICNMKSALSSFCWGSSHSVSVSRNAIPVTVCSEKKNGP